MSKTSRKKPSFLATQIRAKRNAMGLTQVELAVKSGVNRQQLAKLETGTQQDLYGDSITRIAHALEISTDELLGLHREPISSVIAKYLASPLSAYDKPTKDEVAWLRGLGAAVWHGDLPPNEQSVHEIIVWHRKHQSR